MQVLGGAASPPAPLRARGFAARSLRDSSFGRRYGQPTARVANARFGYTAVVPLLFGLSLVGCEPVSSVAIGDALRGGAGGAHDIVIALDVSGSFIEEMDPTVSGLGEMLDAFEADSALDDRIGLVTFTGGAEVFSELTPTSEPASLREQWVGDEKRNLDATKQTGITNCYVTECASSKSFCGDRYFKSLAGDWMMPCDAQAFDGQNGYSSSGDGLALALDLLANSLAFGLDVVLVTDGGLTCPGYSDSEHNECADARAEYATQQADVAIDRGMSVWGVAVNSEPAEEQATFVASLTRGNGQAWSVEDGAGVSEALAQIVDYAR